MNDRKLVYAGKRTKWTSGQIIVFVSLTVIAFIIFFPFYNAVVISFETNRAFTLNPVSLYPTEFSLANYEYLINNGNILSGYKNTIFITVIGTILSMAVSVMMAYAFSRRRFPGKKFLFLVVMFTMLFSGGMIPTYLQFKNLTIDSRWSVILYAGVSTYNIIILKADSSKHQLNLRKLQKLMGQTTWSYLQGLNYHYKAHYSQPLPYLQQLHIGMNGFGVCC